MSHILNLCINVGTFLVNNSIKIDDVNNVVKFARAFDVCVCEAYG
jgi:hypothetical protein